MQLLAAGVSERQIDKRLDKGSLIRVHPGVYRVGHMAPSSHATFIAAVYACGEGAALSGRAAGHLLGLLKGTAAGAGGDSAARADRRGRATRRSRDIEATRWDGIPVTTPARTLVDLAGDAQRLASSAAPCTKQASATAPRLRTSRQSSQGARHAKGTKTLRAILRGDTPITLSRLESAFLRLLRANDLPLPTTNRRAGGRFVDCRWPDHKLTVELDSYRYHASRHAWEQDRKRERQAYARGDQFRRYTWEDVTRNSRPILRELRAVLACV